MFSINYRSYLFISIYPNVYAGVPKCYGKSSCFRLQIWSHCVQLIESSKWVFSFVVNWGEGIQKVLLFNVRNSYHPLHCPCITQPAFNGFTLHHPLPFCHLGWSAVTGNMDRRTDQSTNKNHCNRFIVCALVISKLNVFIWIWLSAPRRLNQIVHKCKTIAN